MKGTSRHHPCLAGFIVAVLTAGAALAGAPTRWIDVHVERAGAAAPIAVHVPAELAWIALGALETGPWDRGVLHLGKAPEGIPAWNALLAMFAAMKPGQSVALEASGVRVKARRAGGIVRIHAVREGERPADVTIALPAEVFSTLTVDGNGDLDLNPLLRRLGTFPPGDLITGRDGDTTARVRIE